jgi:hypothetical protein
MKCRRTRPFVLVLVASAAGAASLSTPEPALAAKALFYVERSFFGAPFPAIIARTHTPGSVIEPTTPNKNKQIKLYGGAGRFENFVEPPTAYPPALGTVTSMNAVGKPFTLPRSFIEYMGQTTAYASTAFKGYTSVSIVTYINGEARFRPNNPYGASMTTRVVFPTVMGNPAPNLGQGLPVTPTTTFGGRYDFSRAGSITVQPGPNRFGGTMRILYSPTSLFYQYIYYFAPLYFKGFGTFTCEKGGIACTEDYETTVGQITSTGMVNRYLLAGKNTIVTVYTPNPTKNILGRDLDPTKPGYQYRPTVKPYAVSKNYYLHLIAPWTTGKVGIYNPDNPYLIKPTLTGYDKDLGGADVTVTRTSTVANYKGGAYKVTYMYYTTKQYLPSVNRVVSLVRPRLIHVYQRPRIPTDPIITNYQALHLWRMKVFFVPEPGALLLLGSAIAGLAGLSLLRRR